MAMTIVAATLATAITASAAPKGVASDGQSNKYLCVKTDGTADTDVSRGQAYQGLRDGTYTRCRENSGETLYPASA